MPAMGRPARQFVDRFCDPQWPSSLLHAVENRAGRKLGEYGRSLRAAIAREPPLYYSRAYAEFVWACVVEIPYWLPQTVVQGIAGEYRGALRLFDFWKELPFEDGPVQEHVLHHAFDECRHSRVYFTLMHLAFPGALSADQEAELRRTQPEVRTLPREKADQHLSEAMVVDCFVRQNLGEIRTHRNLSLLAPLVVACAPAENRERVRSMMAARIDDEVRHISAMAHFIDLWAASGFRRYVRQLHHERLREQNVIVKDEIAPEMDALGAARFSTLRVA